MKALKYLYRIEEVCVISLFISVSVVIFSHVIARYLFRSPFYFTEELCKYCFIWMVMICAAIGIRKGAHTQVTYFTSFLPHRILLLLDIFRNMAILVFLGFLIYYGIFLAMKTIGVKTAALRLPWGIIYFSAPTSAVLMVIHIIKVILHDIHMLFQKGEKAEKTPL